LKITFNFIKVSEYAKTLTGMYQNLPSNIYFIEMIF
jgi:hypothetical protein